MKGYQMTDLVEAFEACVMAETLRWRGEDADVGRVDAFAGDRPGVCSRVGQVRHCGGGGAEAVRSLASAAIDRAKKYGRVLAYTPGT
jgi:hypothetical protein